MASPSSGMGTIIRQRREELGLTQAQLAAHLDVGQQTIAKWERSETHPRPAQMVRLAKRFAITLDQLFGQQATPPPASVEAAIVADPNITDPSRRALLAAYRAALELS